MAKYSIWLNGHPVAILGEGKGPKEAFATAVCTDWVLKEAESREQAQVYIELLDGERKWSNYYYIDNITDTSLMVVYGKNDRATQCGVDVGGVFFDNFGHRAHDIVKNWQQERGFNNGFVARTSCNLNQLRWQGYLDVKINRSPKDNRKNDKFVYMLSVKLKPEHDGVFVAGLFISEADANEARKILRDWMRENDHYEATIYVSKMEINVLSWGDLKLKLRRAFGARDSFITKVPINN